MRSRTGEDAHGPAPVRAEPGRERRCRRLTTFAAALSAVGLAMLVLWLQDGSDQLPTAMTSRAPSAPTLATQAASTVSFTVRFDTARPVRPVVAERVEQCLALPGVQHASKRSTPPVHGVAVASSGEAEEFATCIRVLSGDGVTLTEHRPPPLETAADIAAFVESCAGGRQASPVPGWVGRTLHEALAPDVSSRILGQDGVCNPGTPVLDPTVVDVVISDGLVVWAGHLQVPGATVTGASADAPAPPAAPAGAELCQDSAAGLQCYDLGPHAAERLAAALATRRPQQDTAECPATAAEVYRITWRQSSGVLDPVVWTVPSAACLPMTAGTTRFDLDDAARTTVSGIWSVAGLYAVDGVTTARRPPVPRG